MILPITGNSMRPLFFHKRDCAVLSPCDPLTLKRGDVPLYRRENGDYVLHRIVSVKQDTFTLVGDAQTELERGLPKEAVLAVMTGFIRKGKTVDCRNLRYRLYVAVWMPLRCVRPLFFSLSRWIGRWKRRGKKTR